MKPQPHSEDIERYMIAAALFDNDILHETKLRTEHFYNQRHRIIWSSMQTINNNIGGVDITTLIEHLRINASLETAGGAAYLTGILDTPGSGAFWDQYETTIMDYATRRDVISNSLQAADMAYDMGDTEAPLAHLEKFLTTVKTSNTADVTHAINSAARYATGEALVKTGFRTLDNAFGGFTRNDLTIIGARTSTGKSAFIHAIANNIAYNEGAPVTIFTPDQPIPEVLALQASRECGIPLAFFRHNKATDAQRQTYLTALNNLRNTFLKRINFIPGLLTIDSFQMESIRAIRNGSKAIVIDTVNRFSGGKDKMHMLLAEFGSLAKSIAADYDVPIIALAQLRRELDWEERAPTRADLADAPGALANDANMILLLHREKGTERSRIMNIIVDKAKADAAGGRTLQLYWDPEYATVKELNE